MKQLTPADLMVACCGGGDGIGYEPNVTVYCKYYDGYKHHKHHRHNHYHNCTGLVEYNTVDLPQG